MRYSVIIPVYNTEAYVEQTLRSIMGQTLRDIELIVVNDGRRTAAKPDAAKFQGF